MSSRPDTIVHAQDRSAAHALRRALGSRPYAFSPQAIDQVRGACPVVEVWPGTYAVTGQDACRTVLRDPRFVVEDMTDLAERRPTWSEHPSIRSFNRELLSLNGSRHARLRTVLADMFVPPAAERMRRIVERTVVEVVGAAGGRLTEGGPVVLDEVCTPIPALSISRLLGLPDDLAGPMAAGSDQFGEALRDDFSDPGVLASADRGVEAMQDLLRPFLRPGATPDDSALAALLRERDGLADILDTEESVLANVILLWSAGLDTTRSLLRHVLRTLFERARLAGVLRADVRLRTRFLREMERLHPPIPVTTRTTTEHTVVLGHELPPRSRLLLMLDAANRDVDGDPHGCDLDGPARRSVSFGGGARTCLGLPMARLVLDRFLTEVLQTWPDGVVHDDGWLALRPWQSA